ncbi:MAG: mechanosensitive ion channel protein MscS, partial [Atopobium sp.]|nr:mechanosensitive ion channel protein MscS [Atopobium sp.]
QLDRTLPIEVEASSIAETGIKVIIHVHIKDDANEMSVRDKIVRALAGSSWLAGVGA